MTSVSSGSELVTEKSAIIRHPSKKKLAQRTLRLQKIVGNVLHIGEAYWRKEKVSPNDFYPRLTSDQLSKILCKVPRRLSKTLITVPKNMPFVMCSKLFNVTLKVRGRIYNLEAHTYTLLVVHGKQHIFNKLFEELVNPQQKKFIERMKQSLYELISNCALIILSTNSGPIYFRSQDISVWYFRRPDN